MPNQTIQISSPIKGVNRVANREGQPPQTCWNALNVFPYDVFGRGRVATRYGLSQRYSTNLGNGQIQGMLPVNTVTYSGSIGSPDILLSSWASVPATVSTSANSILYPSTFTDGLADSGPRYTSTIASDGWTLSFNVTFTGTTSDLPVTVWAVIDSTSTAVFHNVASSTRICGTFTLDPTTTLVASQSELQITSNTTGGTGGNIAFTGPSLLTPLSTAIPCTLHYSSTGGGQISGSINGVATDSNTSGPNNGYLTVTPPGGGNYIYFFSSANDADQKITLSGIKISFGATPLYQANYNSILIAVCQGLVWIGQSGSTGTISEALGQSSGAFLNNTKTVSMANVNFTAPGSTDANAVGQAVYFVDGMTASVAVLNLVTSTMSTLVAKTSTALPPTSTSLACAWRGRLVLAGDPANPQNFYMSRAGDPSDWDYSQTDPAAAVAGNLSRSGQIGEPITALIPYTDDYMLIGCAHSIWMLEGDPADGGTIVQVSGQMGIVGKDAWCVDPTGTLYFIASGGLYSVRPIWQAYRPPELLSAQSWNQFFLTQDWNTTIVSMAYDSDHHYLHMFFTPTSANPGIHLTYDLRNQGLWPQQFHGPQGPFSSCLYISDNSAAGRNVLIGGWDGLIRKLDPAATDDDGNNIQANIVLGPINPFPGEAAILSAATVDLGELNTGASSTTSTGQPAFQAVADLSAGPDAYAVTEGKAHVSTAVAFNIERRQKTMRQRLRGAWFTLNLANGVDNAYFSFESATLEFAPGGRNRERKP